MKALGYMRAKLNILCAVSRDERGVSALEYGLLAGALSLGMVVALGTFSNALAGAFNALSNLFTRMGS